SRKCRSCAQAGSQSLNSFIPNPFQTVKADPPSEVSAIIRISKRKSFVKTALNDSRPATVSTFGISQSDSSWNHPLATRSSQMLRPPRALKASLSNAHFLTSMSSPYLQTQLQIERHYDANCFGPPVGRLRCTVR